MRRNLKTQPYGRCSVCSLELPQCHAWQFSGLSFALIISALSLMIVPPGWAQTAIALAIVGQVIYQGMLNHKRTDDLIFGQHELRQASVELENRNRVIERARDNLESEVVARTAQLREANRDLAQANLEAVEFAQRRENSVVDISHNLRTPITSIKGAAQNLLDGVSGPLNSDQREYIEIIREHAQRVNSVAETIIEAARGAEPAVSLDTRPRDIAKIALDVVRGLQPAATERGIDLSVDVEPTEIEVDEAKLRTVLENLLSNALKFTDAGGRVKVAVAPSRTGASVSVSDTGIGIGSEDRQRIFQRFYRSGARRPGMGVGLAIVRDLVRLHGGELEVDSRLGEGSTFTVMLPQKAA